VLEQAEPKEKDDAANAKAAGKKRLKKGADKKRSINQ
jgi:hypothetical protein